MRTLLNPYRLKAATLTGSDSFNRADGNLRLSALDNALGGSGARTWANHNNTGAVTSTFFNISGNRVIRGATTSVGATSADFGLTDVSASFKVTSMPTTTMQISVLARGGANPYTDNVRARVDLNGKVELVKSIANVDTVLGATANGALVVGDTLEIEAIGDVKRAKINGVVVVQVTDSDNAAGTLCGIRKTSSSGQFEIDEFRVTGP